MNMPVVVEKDKDGFFAYCPSLQGCYTQGISYEDVLKNIKDVIKLCVFDDKSYGKFSTSSELSLTSVEVRV